MFNKRFSAVFIMTVLALTAVSQSRAAQVIDIRSNSEADKTRIVVELDGTAQYQAHYTSEPGISICLLEAGLKSARKTISIGDELVETAALKEVMGNIVEVSISLKKGAAFTIFPLESPERIVVDVMPDAAMVTPQPVSVPTDGSEAVTGKSPETPEHEDVGISKLPFNTRDTVPAASISVFPLQNTDYMLAQLCFNALLVVALIALGIKLWRVSRVLKKSRSTLKEGADFADMVNRLELGGEENSNSLGQQHALPIIPDIPGKAQKRRKRKGRATLSTADQKQYEKVHKLAQLGMDRMEISQQSNVPIGEVNLILNLTKARSQAKAN
ncbi:AMIN domain-containing protein [Candidatus Poribacteria bacterium]